MIKKEFLKVKLTDLIPYANNPRDNEDAIADVAESIKQCGDLDPIEVDENNVILSGHTRLKALKRRGEKETDIIRYTGLSEEQKKKYRLLANKTGEKAKWNEELLSIELEGLDFGGFDFGFPEDEQKELEAQGHTVLNPAMLPKGLRPVSYMTICMALIDAADALYILPTYDGVNSKGTELEIDYARYQQKKIMHKAVSSRK